MSNPAYPVSLPLIGTRTLRDGRNEDTTGDGSMRVRKLFADKYDFEIKHPGLSSGQQSTLETFVSTNATASAIDLVWPEDGVTYVVVFRKDAISREWKAGGKRSYVVRLGGV